MLDEEVTRLDTVVKELVTEYEVGADDMMGPEYEVGAVSIVGFEYEVGSAVESADTPRVVSGVELVKVYGTKTWPSGDSNTVRVGSSEGKAAELVSLQRSCCQTTIFVTTGAESVPLI